MWRVKMTNKTVIVVGASRGIGLGFVEKYLALGCNVIATHRAASNLDDLNRNKKQYGDKLVLFEVDLNNAAQIIAFTEGLHESVEKVDLLILNAGTTGNNEVLQLEPKPLNQETIWSELELSNNVHYLGPLRLILGLTDKLQNKNACIVYLTTPHALGSKTVGVDAHASSKAAGTHMIYCRCKEMVKKWFDQSNEPEELAQAPGAFAIYPGWVKTDMGGKNARLKIEDSVDKMVAVIDTVISNKKFNAVYSHDGNAMNLKAYVASEELTKVIAAAEKGNQKKQPLISDEVTGDNQVIKTSDATPLNLPFFIRKDNGVSSNPANLSGNTLG